LDAEEFGSQQETVLRKEYRREDLFLNIEIQPLERHEFLVFS